ncbi:MAG: hypothetical protein JXR78_18010 [Victivallales bacterium]|nr:hypothetical protein [Victivallales bacterium]
MGAFWSITKLTAKSALRSHVFQLLLTILVLCAFLVPATISGDGTAYGFIQISLKYSLGVTAFLLSLTTVWLGCFSLSADVESYQLHMITSKPVSRVKIWLGKCFGVILIHAILLIISAAVIYTIIIWQYHRKDFSAADKEKISSEVLIARRVFYPELPDINQLAREMYQRRIQELARDAQTKNLQIDEKAAMDEMRKKALASLSEVEFGPAKYKSWVYRNLPASLRHTEAEIKLILDGKLPPELRKPPMYLRFRMYVNKISSKDQRQTRGMWYVFFDRKTGRQVDGKDELEPHPFPTSDYPKQYMTGVFHEFMVSPLALLSDNTVRVLFQNFDPENQTLYFQVADGPKLLVQVGGFLENYARAVLVIFLRLVILAGLACAVGGIMSMPTAVFLVFSYLVSGIFADFLIGAEGTVEGVMGFIGYWVSQALMVIVIPMQKFEVSHFISNGELIEWSFIGGLFFKYFILKALPIFIIGILLYRRRELGLVVRK